MKNEYEDVEYILSRAKECESKSHGAEMIRVSMRLGTYVTWYKRTTTRLRIKGAIKSSESILSAGERSALYDALAIVRDDAAKEAKHWRSQIAVVPRRS